jgi:hypothetical protein
VDKTKQDEAAVPATCLAAGAYTETTQKQRRNNAETTQKQRRNNAETTQKQRRNNEKQQQTKYTERSAFPVESARKQWLHRSPDRHPHDSTPARFPALHKAVPLRRTVP